MMGPLRAPQALQVLPPIPGISRSFQSQVVPLGAPCPLPHCAGSPVDMCPPTLPAECEQCVTQCDLETCRLNTEAQCTDRCLVVPCEDPCLDSCGVCTTPHAFEDFFKSASALSYSETIAQDHNSAPYPDWSSTSLCRELDALICACRTQSLPHPFDCSSCDPALLHLNKSCYSSQQQQPPATAIPVSTPIHSPRSSVTVLNSPKLTSTPSSCSSPAPSPLLTVSPHPSPRTMSHPFSHHSGPSDRQHSSDPLQCRWAACRMLFDTPRDLVTHVNTAHLQLSRSSKGVPTVAPPFHQQPPTSPDSTFPDLLSCLWDNCSQFPTPSQLPGPSAGNIVEAAKGFLAYHVQQDHLGIPVSHQSTSAEQPETILDAEPVFPDVSSHGPASAAASTSLARRQSAPSPPGGHRNSHSGPDTSPAPSQSLCKWQGCAQAGVRFGSVIELTAHITDVHVGVGNSRYHCLWDGCNRHGDSGFTSKQKILRHIQSHTGYRPFRCELCDQYFSEAATLQQHMRRHTKEKPYICDFPGCDKAFAITGALTIHRRVHSGSKPFKCPHCNRSFSESSNLSKHVRTHTGDRPYACPYPGCEKRFARPDQVARHKNVHTKKRKTKYISANMATLSEDGMDVDE